MSKEVEHNGSETIEKMIEMDTDTLLAMSQVEIAAFLKPALTVLPATQPEPQQVGKKASRFKTVSGTTNLGDAFKKKGKKGKSSLLQTLERQSAKNLNTLNSNDKKSLADQLAKEIGMEPGL